MDSSGGKKREENGWHVVLNLFDIVPKIISVNYFVESLFLYNKCGYLCYVIVSDVCK